MPYPFAHPAAVLPLAPLLGRIAVPSALAIGAMIPDAWYFVPGLVRADSHSPWGLVWFCLPAGLAVYFAFQGLLKAPLLALLPRALASRLVIFAGAPRASLHAIVISLLAGAITHLAWDAVAHSYSFGGIHVLQHLSTLLGTAALLAWCRQRLRRLEPRPLPADLDIPGGLRLGLLLALAVVLAAAAVSAPHAPDLREALRQAWTAGMSALGAALLVLGLAWKRRR